MIIISDIVTATTADLLSGTRLAQASSAGVLVCQFLADLNDATNNFALKIQLPDGDVPIDGMKVPGVNPSLAGVLDERQLFQWSTRVAQGTAPIITLTETGTAICSYRIVWND